MRDLAEIQFRDLFIKIHSLTGVCLNTWHYSPKCLETFFFYYFQPLQSYENWTENSQYLKYKWKDFPLEVSSLRKNGLYLGITDLSKNTHFTYPIFNIVLSIVLITLAPMLNEYEISIQQTIWFSICNISYIGCSPAFWTVMVMWYHHCVTANMKINTYQLYRCSLWFYRYIIWYPGRGGGVPNEPGFI